MDIKTSLVAKLNNLIQQNAGARRDTFEAYLFSNARKYLSAIQKTESKEEIEKATHIFSRFCTESMDWDTDLYRTCMDLVTMGLKVAKQTE